MYTLYVNKQTLELKVKKAKTVLLKEEFTDQVTAYNQNYYFCNNRKPLVDKAREIKAEWIRQTEYKLNQLNSLKI